MFYYKKVVEIFLIIGETAKYDFDMYTSDAFCFLALIKYSSEDFILLSKTRSFQLRYKHSRYSIHHMHRVMMGKLSKFKLPGVYPRIREIKMYVGIFSCLRIAQYVSLPYSLQSHYFHFFLVSHSCNITYSYRT